MTGDSMEPYTIEFPSTVTQHFFYTHVLKQVNDHQKKNPDGELVFDFYSVEYVEPLVIPNLCALCAYLKKKGDKPRVELNLSWNPSLLKYLYQMDFFAIAKEKHLFKYNEQIVGGFDSAKPKHAPGYTYKCMVFDFNATLETILAEIRKSLGLIYAIRDSSSTNIDLSIIDEDATFEKLKKAFAEIIRNGCTHSGSMCFVIFQKMYNSTTKEEKVIIAVSECGNGYLRTLMRQIDSFQLEPKFLHYKDENELRADPYRNLRAILEAVYYYKERPDPEYYGLYHVAGHVIHNRGKMKINYKDTELIIDSLNNGFNMNPRNKTYQEVFDDILKSDIYAIRKVNFEGVHISIEIPIHKGKRL
jgi:hypothetical protein